VGFSLGEILLLIVVGIIVVGPKRLPGMMRTAGQWVARLRRMSMDLRSQSGIDDLLRQEGLEQHIHELRSLSRMSVVETLITAAPAPAHVTPSVLDTPAAGFDKPQLRAFTTPPREPAREREYPIVGCDAYGALPDDVAMYLPTAPSVTMGKDSPSHPAEAPSTPEQSALLVDVGDRPEGGS
jgi:sec-independent protein translocase protein TatB